MKFPRTAQQKREFWMPVRYAALIFFPCTLIGYAELFYLRGLGRLFPLTNYGYAVFVLNGAALFNFFVYLAAFTWVSAHIGGSRKIRVKAIHGVVTRVWQMEFLLHIGIIVILTKHPLWLAPSEAVAQAMIPLNLINTFAVYLFFLMVAAVGKAISFRLVPAPEDDWGQYRQ